MFFDNSIHSVSDARRLAKKRLPWMVFDYIDGAAGDGSGEAANIAAMRAIRLQPRALVNVENRDLSMPLFGQSAGLPFGISPMGMCNLSAPGADVLLARSAARYRIPVGVSTVASTSLETMAEKSDGQAWFQLYCNGNEDVSNQLIDRCIAAGYQTLVLTVDVAEVGRRPRELRRGFKMPFKIGVRQFVDFACHPRWSVSTLLNGKPDMANFGGAYASFDRTASRASTDWDVLARVRDRWPGKLVVKGVLNVEDASRLRAEGVDAVQVSSHGGRQLDCAPLPIVMLAKIRAAVGPDYPVFYDSGIRSGEDILKAYAMGADYVFIGRPFQFSIAAGGEAGLTQLCNLLRDETSIAMALLGVADMAAITADRARFIAPT